MDANSEYQLACSYLFQLIEALLREENELQTLLQKPPPVGWVKDI